jgi:transcriptional regulator of acetoin/glycerol metabolism
MNEPDSKVAKIWERFVSGVDADLSRLRPEIAQSWVRCRSMQVQPALKRVPQS